MRKVVDQNRAGAPGKFYGSESSQALMVTLRADGPCSRVSLVEDPTDREQQTYHRFLNHLHNAEVVSNTS